MGGSKFVINPKLIESGTICVPPDFWMTGSIQSNEVAPPSPIAVEGKRGINNGIKNKQTISREMSLKKAILPSTAPQAS